MDLPLAVLADPVDEAATTLLAPKFRVRACPPGSPVAECRAQIREAEAVIVRTFKIDAELMEASPHLKVIAKHGAGYDNIDVPAATRLGIVVANVPGGNAAAVAETTVSMMLSAIRRAPEVHALLAGGDWDTARAFRFGQLANRTLGLVGFGNIGRRVASICGHGFGMQVLGFDPLVSSEDMSVARVEKVASLEELLQRSDVVSLHAPLTPETRHLISREELRLMKPTAILVNAARGALVDAAALHEALTEGLIGGAAIDVFEVEPVPAGDPLLSAPRIVLSPHVSGTNIEAIEALARASAEIVLSTRSGEPPAGFLNPEVWTGRRV